ncbi:MAG TPA: hypothetical protein VF696_00845 [Candidatus Paceibacterota bacterium]|jgi:hypothetical protein
MATIVNTPGGGNDNSGPGWAVAVIVLLVVLIGAFLLWGRGGGDTVNVDVPAPNVNIPTPNVDVPTPDVSGGAGGGASAQ